MTGKKEIKYNIKKYKSNKYNQKPLFDSSEIKNFAFWNSDLNYLSEIKNPVDLLIIQYDALKANITNQKYNDLNDSLYDEDTYDSNFDTGTFENESYNSTINATNNEIIHSRNEVNYFNSYNTNSPRYNSMNNVSSLESIFSTSSQNLNNYILYTIENYGAKRIVIEIDLTQYPKGTNNIYRYILKRLKKLIKDLAIHWIWGFYISNIQSYIDKHDIDSANNLIYDIGKAYPQQAIFTDITKIDEFEKVRDLIHGIILKNIVFYQDGKQKSKWEWDRNFSEYIVSLRKEISLRTDFMVMDVEVILPDEDGSINHYQKRKYFRNWIQGNNFKGWISYDSNFKLLRCVSPPEFPMVNDSDIYEICSNSDILNCKELVTSTLSNINWHNKKIDSNTWKNIFNKSNFPREIINGIPSIYNINQSKITSAIISIPKKPEKPQIPEEFFLDNESLNSNDQDNNNKNYLSGIWKKPSHNIRVFSVTQIGKTYGNERRQQVEIKLIDIMINLLEKNLLKPLNTPLPNSNSLSSISYSTSISSKSFLNEKPQELQPQMKEIIDNLSSIIKTPSPLVVNILNNVFGGFEKAIKYIKELHEGLLNNNINIYIGTNSSFLLKEKTDELPYKKVWALMGLDDDEKLYIFIPENNPSITELVLNCYFRRYFRNDSGKCLLMESLVNAQKNSSVVPISNRVFYEIENKTYSDLFYFIRNTYLIQSSLKSKVKNKFEEMLLTEYSEYINKYSYYLLIDKFKYHDKNMEQLKSNYVPKNKFENEIYNFIAYCLLDPNGNDRVKEFVKCISNSLKQIFNDDSSETVGLCYLFISFWKASRRVAWINMESLLISMNPSYLPDADQVSVAMEMITTQTNLNMMFGFNSHQLAGPMHTILRQRVKNSKKIDEYIQIEDIKSSSGNKKARQLANAFLFVYPVIVDLILVKIFGSGIFINKYMNDETKNMINFIFLFIFPICGGLMNSIARTCTFYFFYKSFSLMISAFIRRFSASIIILSTTSVLIGIGSLFITDYDVTMMFLFMLYSFFFGIYMVFFSILGSIKSPDKWIYKNKGPSIALQASIILLIPNIICYLTFNDESNSKIVLSIYVFGFFISNLRMLYGYRNLSREYLKFTTNIKIPTNEQILEYYEISNPKPTVFSSEDMSQYSKRVSLWERAARKYYMKKVTKEINAVSKRKLLKQNNIVSDRVKQQPFEDELMDWYLLRTGTKNPPLKYSSEWDTMLKCGVDEIKKKIQVEKLNRGDLLFDFERVVIYFGVFYFIYIFVDKWSLLFFEGKPYLFLPEKLQSNSDVPFELFLTGSLYATLFMLICSGFLELTLTHILKEKNSDRKSSRLGWSTSEEMLKKYKKDNQHVYKIELIKFIFIIIAILGITVGVVISCHGIEVDMLKAFGIVSFGFIGFLIGLYHKLFFESRDCEVRLNKYLILIILTCIGISCIFKFVVKTYFYSFYSTCIGGWLFCIISTCICFRSMNSDAHYSVSLAPHLASSGQRFIGQSNDLLARENLEQQLRDHITKNYQEISDLIKKSVFLRITESKEKYKKLSNRNILKRCFPEADCLLQDIFDGLTNDHIIVKIIPDEYFKIKQNNYSAYSYYDKSKNILEIFTYIPQFINNNNDEIEPNLIEWITSAIVHEYAEQIAGYSHNEATLLEFIIMDGENLQNLPIRFLYQISVSTKTQLKKLIYGYVNLEHQKALLDIDIDCVWETASNNTKLFLVQLNAIWYKNINKISKNYNIDSIAINGDIPSDLIKLLNENHNRNMKINQIITCSVFSVYIGRRISDLALNNNMPIIEMKVVNRSRSKIKKTFTRKYSITRSISRSINRKNSKKDKINNNKLNVMLLSNTRNSFIETYEKLEFIIYLALTGDARYGREFSTSNHFYITRLLLFIIFKISINIRWFISKRFYLNEDDTKMVLTRLKKGTFREKYYNQNKKISKIISYNSSLCNCVSIVENNDNEDTIVTTRYLQSKINPEWKPSDNDKPISNGYFNIKSKRLVKEYELDNNKNIISTLIYEYSNDSQMFPRKIYKLKGKRNVTEYDNFVEISESQDLMEEHFLTSNIPSLISMTTLYVKNNKKENIEIQVNYSYDNNNTSLHFAQHLFTTYKCLSEKWVMIVYYAEKWKIGDFSKDVPPKLKEIHFYYLDDAKTEYVTEYDYSHPQHVKTKTVMFSKEAKFDPMPVPTPSEISNDTYNLLKRRPPPSFYFTNEFLTYKLKASTSRSNIFSNKGKKVSYFSGPFSTARNRQEIWAFWRAGNLPGVLARDIDENILRNEPVLKNYWKHRDLGLREMARSDLQKEKEALDVLLIVNDLPSTRTNLHLRYNDLAILATGGDATEISSSKDIVKKNPNVSYFSQISYSKSKINRPSLNYSIGNKNQHIIKISDESDENENEEILDVVNLDSGTWPTGGGGVGSCRRDLIDYLDRIKWTAIVEIGGAELVQRDYQIERNITSIRYLPLWDVDFSSPNENIYRDHDYLSLRRKTQATRDNVIQNIFIPIVETLIEGMIETKFTEDNLQKYEKLFVDMYLYFQKCDWSISWNHKKTQMIWIKAWLEFSKIMLADGKAQNVEMPTITEIDMLFSLTTRLLLPITAEIPKISVFHASHHGVQAIIGVIAKHLNGSRLIIWDHGILWRERLFGLCYSDSMPRFIQNGFIGLTRLITWIIFNRADYITPCTQIQNVTWEEWLGGRKYFNNRKAIETREKIYPIVNGMNVAKFNPKPENENPTPLVVMLSHISSVKDIHNAIYSANIIVNKLKIRSYTLHIYGSLQKDPNYTAETINLITNLNLTQNVILKGLGNPSNVLTTGWLFVNSSITEGLPLAIGEAGLCGLPVVCTDVGGSREVVSDLKTNVVFGAIVPPQKPNQLAHAQLRVLCMSDGLEDVVDHESSEQVKETKNEGIKLENLLKEGPEAVERRMNNPLVKEKRRALGYLLRKRTIDEFSITRYWRQHEQLLWLGQLSNKREKAMDIFE